MPAVVGAGAGVAIPGIASSLNRSRCFVLAVGAGPPTAGAGPGADFGPTWPEVLPSVIMPPGITLSGITLPGNISSGFAKAFRASRLNRNRCFAFELSSGVKLGLVLRSFISGLPSKVLWPGS